MRRNALIACRSAVGLAAVFGLVASLTPRLDADDPRSPSAPTLAGTVAPAMFPTPEEAAKAYFDAMERNDDGRLAVLLGSSDSDLVQDGRDPTVARGRGAYAAGARAKLDFDRSREAEGVLVMLVGTEGHPVSIPVAKGGAGWFLDAGAGRTRLLERRIGRNELAAIAICRTYVEAQVAYASRDRDGDGLREYAQKLVSTPGSHDGLIWGDGAASDEPSPLGVALTPLRAFVEGHAPVAPFGGYFWRILKRQGAHAPGGSMSFVAGGHMTSGFALIAVPARYRVTGVKSFLVSHLGEVYEKDLGETGLDTAQDVESYDPDETWTAVDDPGDDDPDGGDVAPSSATVTGVPDHPSSPAAPSPGATSRPDCR